MRQQRALLSLTVTAVVGLLAICVGSTVGAQSLNRVALAVQFGDGNTVTRCVAFAEPEISGYDLLVRSGMEIVGSYYPGTGAGICSINGEGCGAADCYCECRGSTCLYWSYWHLVGGDWTYSHVGASEHRARDGDVEGWRWSDGEPPLVIGFAEICAPPPTDTPTPRPAAPTPPPSPEAWFRLDQNPIAAGACTIMRWDIWHAHAAHLDGDRVGLTDWREVCPTAPQTYSLRVVGTDTEVTYELVLGVTGAMPSATRPALPSATVATPTTQAATAVELKVSSPDPSPTSTSTAAPTSTSTSTPGLSTPTWTPNKPSSTVAHATQAQPPPTTTGPPMANRAEAPASPFARSGYVVFVLAAGSLLAWLVLEMRRQG